MRTFLIIPLLLVLSFVPACDWQQYAFINSVPFHGDPAKNPEVHVFIAVDGLPYSTAQDAVQRNVFKGGNFQLSKMVSMFPATSDAAWTRILHTKEIGGYEYTYFDPGADAIQNKGYSGLLKHIIPVIVDGLNFEAPYMKAFDYRANGYTHTVGVYHDTFANFAESLDNLFFLLEGRAETKDAFSAYLMEIDAMGHILTKEDVAEALRILATKIQKFKTLHPERRFLFTLLSDHGNDFIQVDTDKVVTVSDAFAEIGITAVESLKGHDPKKELFAVPIDHVRVTYQSISTAPELIPEVSKRTSTLSFVEFSVAHLHASLAQLKSFVPHSESFGIWENGKLILEFSYDPSTNEYLLASNGDWERIGLKIQGVPQEKPIRLSDSDLFKKMVDTEYPDFFYRIRSGLSHESVRFPADILLSFRPGYVSMGFKLPLAGKDFSLSGFHGSLRAGGTLGTILTEETGVPPAVRADNVLEFFPKLKANILEKGLPLFERDRNASLHY